MTSPSHQDPAQKPENNGDQRREELRRERELVRSTGMISKWVMAIAFGLVFLLAALATAAAAAQWTLSVLLGAIGLAAIFYGFYAWGRTSRRRSL